jgi:hypothetical protein
LHTLWWGCSGDEGGRRRSWPRGLVVAEVSVLRVFGAVEFEVAHENVSGVYRVGAGAAVVCRRS